MLRRSCLLPALPLLLLIAALAPGQAPDEDLARELPRLKPTEPAEALKTFQIHEGFRLEPLAVEPDVTDPVSVCYDEDGRLYVVEMRGYPYPEDVPSGCVRLLVDEDWDGKVDRSTVFLDGLSWPTSVVPYDGGVFVAVAPDILYAKDTDGDGKADVRKVMFSGFGTQNVQALVNGLLWGPDGWIYGVAAGNGGEIKNHSRPDEEPVNVRGRDFRFRPDGSAFEVTSGGGQFGHAFDDWGHRFTCNNSDNIRQLVLPAEAADRNPALATPPVIASIAADGAAGPVFRISPPEPWRVVRTRQRLADPKIASRLAPTEKFAAGFFTSATGVTIYRGSAFPTEYRGNAFIGDVGGNLIHRKILSVDGPILRAERADAGKEFLASTDNWFRPVNFANTPDGTLLVLDMYRETIEHPASIPEPIKKHLDLTSGHDRGRLYQLVPDGFRRRERPALGKATTAELVATLADRDAWHRETAQRLLIERKDEAAIPPLHRLAADRPTPLARTHALWTLAALGQVQDAEIVAALSDPEPRVREQGARLASGRGGAVAGALIGRAEDPDAMVRLQVALSLGTVRQPEAVGALATIAARDPGDRWIRAAVLTSAGGRALPLAEAMAKVPGLLGSPEGRVWLSDLSALVGAENRPEAVQALLARFAGAGADPVSARAAVVGLGTGLRRTGGSLRGVLAGPAGAAVAPLFARAAELAQGDGDSRGRVEAIRLLGLGPVAEAMRILPDLLDARQPVAVQLAALQTLADLPDERVGPAVVTHWSALGPAVRREAIEVLFARPERLAALLSAVEAGTIAPTDLDPARRAPLLAHKDPAIRARAARLFGGPARADRGKVIASFQSALTLEGDAERGRAVHTKVCATCHQAEGRGTAVGPDLATVATRTPEDLLVHILDPNREVAPNYVNYTVATEDGRVLSGLIAEESAGSITLKRAEGASDVVPRARIEAIASTGLSLMPEGLEQGLEAQDFADLIAYIRGLASK